MRTSFLHPLFFVAIAHGCASNPPPTSSAPPSTAQVPAPEPAARPELPPISSDFPREWASQRGYGLGEPSQVTPTEDGRHVFFLRAAAVAGALVADLKDYDAIYEPYVGPENSPVYEDASLLTWASRPPTAKSPARPFLLMHGTADDNVYFANALKFAEAMGRGGRPLDFLPILGGTHMPPRDAIVTIWSRTAQHFRDHL